MRGIHENIEFWRLPWFVIIYFHKCCISALFCVRYRLVRCIYCRWRPVTEARTHVLPDRTMFRGLSVCSSDCSRQSQRVLSNSRELQEFHSVPDSFRLFQKVPKSFRELQIVSKSFRLFQTVPESWREWSRPGLAACALVGDRQSARRQRQLTTHQSQHSHFIQLRRGLYHKLFTYLAYYFRFTGLLWWEFLQIVLFCLC